MQIRKAGRFRARYRDEELLWLVRIALEHHHEAGIAGLSRSDYERLRTAIGHPAAPSAKRIATRLGLPWSEVVELALNEQRDVPRTLGRRGAAPRGAAATVRDRERALSALASVATRLGVKKLSAMAYDAERERIAIESHRAATLPTSWQIARLYGKSWTAATRDAGLAPGGRGRRPGIALSDAAELCLHTTGALPTYAELCRFARANYVTIVRAGNSNSNWSTALSDLRARRDADGLWTPTRPPAKRDRPDYDAPILTSTPRALGRTFWSTEECVRGLIAFLDWLADNGEAGDAATQRRYNRWSAGHPEHPWGKTIIDHGGFTALLDQAIRRRSHPPEHHHPIEESLQRLLASARKPHLHRILEYAEGHATFTSPELVPVLGVKVEAVYAQLQKLRAIGVVERLEPRTRADRRGNRPYEFRLVPAPAPSDATQPPATELDDS